ALSPVSVPSPVWARPYASGGRRAAFAQISLGVTVAIFALAAWLDLLTMMIAATAGPLLTDDQFTLIDQLQVALTVVWLAALVIAAIAFLVWIHRAYRNLPAVGAILIVRRIQAWQEQKAATLAGASGMESPRGRWYSQRLTGALALVLVVLLLAGSSAAVYAQGSYPGGLAQWLADRSSPAQLSDQ